MLKHRLFFLILILLNRVFAYELEPIVVKKKNNQIYVLSSEELEYRTFFLKNLDLLGMELTPRNIYGNIQSDFCFRGSNFEGVGIFLNGKLINDPQTGHFHGEIPFTIEDIQDVSLTSSAFSSYLNTGSGAIKFSLKKPKEKKFVLSSILGSHQLKTGLFSLAYPLDRAGYRFSFENQESSGGYPGREYKKRALAFSYHLKADESTEFNLNFGYQGKNFGAYDFYTPNRGFFSYEEIDTYLLISDIEINKEEYLLRPSVLWRRNKDRFLLDRHRPKYYANKHITDIINPTVSLERDSFSGKIKLEIQNRQENIVSNRLGKHSRNIESLSAEYNREFGKIFSYILSARCDMFKKNSAYFSGAFGFRYNFLDSQDLIFGISRNVRFPNFTEIYYEDPTTSGNRFLSVEEFLNKEIAYQYNRDKSLFKFIFFFRKEENSIDWIKHDKDQIKWTAQNLPSIKARGIEFIFKNEIKKLYEFILHYIYVDKDKPPGIIFKYGPNYSNHRIVFSNQFSFSSSRVSLNLSYKKKPQRRGWFVLDCLFSYQINKNLEAFINVYNFFNEEYQEIPGIPNEDRQIEFGVRFCW